MLAASRTPAIPQGAGEGYAMAADAQHQARDDIAWGAIEAGPSRTTRGEPERARRRIRRRSLSPEIVAHPTSRWSWTFRPCWAKSPRRSATITGAASVSGRKPKRSGGGELMRLSLVETVGMKSLGRR